jgi:acetyl-CoA synthetase
MADNKVSTFCAPPTVYRFFVRENLADYDLSALRYCTTAGETIEAAISESWTAKTGLKIHEGYGQTETHLLWRFPLYGVRPGSSQAAPVGGEPQYECEPVGVGEEGRFALMSKRARRCGSLRATTGPRNRRRDCTAGYTTRRRRDDADGTLVMGRRRCYQIPRDIAWAIRGGIRLASHPAVVEAAVTGFPIGRGRPSRRPSFGQGLHSTRADRELLAHVKHTYRISKARVIEYL